MTTLKKILTAVCALALGASAAFAAPEASSVRVPGVPYNGRIATVLMPQGWQKGTFDSTTWLDLVAPGDSKARPTVRFEKKNMYSRSEQEFLDKFQGEAQKAGARRVQKARVGGQLFYFYLTPSKKRPVRGEAALYDMKMASDWPRKSGSFRDCMTIAVTGRPLMGNWTEDKAAELIHKGLLNDAPVMAILQSVAFTDAPFTPLAVQQPAQPPIGGNPEPASALEEAVRIGRIAGIWKPVMLKVAGRDLEGSEMEEAAAGKKRTFIFNADGTFSYEPKILTWTPKEGQQASYVFGDLSGRLWFEKGQLHFQDGGGFHFVYDKVPNPNPSDAELLAGVIGEWQAVEVIENEKTAMGEDLGFAMRRNSFRIDKMQIRADGAINSDFREGTWKIENGQVLFDFDGLQLQAFPGRIEAANGKGARCIYVPAERAASHRSVFQAEYEERERQAAKDEPVIGLWIPFAGEDAKGNQTVGESFTRFYGSTALPLLIVSDGTIREDGKVRGSWRNDGGYIFNITEGRYKGRVLSFDGTVLQMVYSDNMTFRYMKKR